MNTNQYTFYNTLRDIYAVLFVNDEEFIRCAKHTTPECLALRMTEGLTPKSMSVNWSGKSIKATCKKLGIPHKYKAIHAFLNESVA